MKDKKENSILIQIKNQLFIDKKIIKNNKKEKEKYLWLNNIN